VQSEKFLSDKAKQKINPATNWRTINQNKRRKIMLETKNNQIVNKITTAAFLVLLVAAFSAIPTKVFADESWTSNIGYIIYEDDTNNTAIFLFATPGKIGEKTRLFIHNLVPDLLGTRTTYSGYWTDTGKGELCEASMTDPLGTTTKKWGRFKITFEKAAKQQKAGEFTPWNWTGYTGDCFDEPTRKITAVADTGPE
jgi:hypothetical protein